MHSEQVRRVFPLAGIERFRQTLFFGETDSQPPT
jgi:hypothetical protein